MTQAVQGHAMITDSLIVADEASPKIRYGRERRRLAHLESLIAEHERGRPEGGVS
ncbi:hypothetical protein [Streptomyces sp. NPDC051219]|uniref:hypothetical protein n=1 Tax=Streptomyces sp. NPDC051219 TaxID=3155283 RepID=UPI00343824C8